MPPLPPFPPFSPGESGDIYFSDPLALGVGSSVNPLDGLERPIDTEVCARSLSSDRPATWKAHNCQL
eukprot:6203218-Pleurochrysis_carterae.AAC.1